MITGALRKLVVIPSGGTPSTAQVSDASDALNALVKAFQADGMPLWKIKEQTFTTAIGTANYTVGPAQTINIPKPLKILRADRDNIIMNVYTRYDFKDLPVSTGTPINFYYQPGRNTGVISLWPTPDAVTEIVFQYHSPYEDMDNSTDDFDFPSEWIMALIYNLAWVLSPEFGIPINDRGAIMKEAQYWHDYALSMGNEEGSITFQPDNQM